MNTLQEKLLVYRLQTHKDTDAFAGLYDLYVKRIYRFVFFKVGTHEDAEDIVSETFLRTWNVINEGGELKSFSGLLYRVARNLIVDWYRARAVRPEAILSQEQDVGDEGKWSEDKQINLETKELLELLKRLKQEYREVITLRYVDELEVSEIAAITGKGNIAVRVTLHRALKKLKELTDK